MLQISGEIAMARSKLTLSVSKTGQPDLGKSILSATLFTVLQGGVPVAQQQPVLRSIGPPGAPPWFWPGRIQAGEVTVIEGDAGVGKSFVACDLAARFSRGTPFPGEVAPLADAAVGGAQAAGTEAAGAAAATRPAGNVLFVTLQEGSNVIDNRLHAMGADCERILMFGMVRSCEIKLNNESDESKADLAADTTGGSADIESGIAALSNETTEERPVSFPFDLPMVEHYMKTEPKIGLVVIDPLSDFCQTAGQLEATLRKLQMLAQRSGIAIVVTLPAYARFDSKGAFKSSSRWKSDVARAVWSIAADPDDRQRRLFFPRRTNGMSEPNGLEFRIQSGQVAWNEQTIVSFDDPLGRETEIRNFLKGQLQHQSQPAREIFQSGSDRGYTRAQIRYVAKRMGINGHNGPGTDEAGEWTWLLPGQFPGQFPGHDEFPRVEPLDSAINDHFEKSQAMNKEDVITAYLKSRLLEKLKAAANQNEPNFQTEEDLELAQFREEFFARDEQQLVTGELPKETCGQVAESAAALPALDSDVPSAVELSAAREENFPGELRPTESTAPIKDSVEPNREVKSSPTVAGKSERRPNAQFLLAQSRRQREKRRAKKKRHRQAVKKGRG